MRCLCLFGLLLAAACGGTEPGNAAPDPDGGTPTGPGPGPNQQLYPAVAGVYPFTGTFDDAANWTMSGTLTLGQPSRSAPELIGSLSITYDLGTGDRTYSDRPIENAVVGFDGRIQFTVFLSNLVITVWDFTGTASGMTITGRHVFVTPTEFAGTWTATRASP